MSHQKCPDKIRCNFCTSDNCEGILEPSQPGSQSESSQSKPKRYRVQISDGRWVKRTSHFGMFHGRIVLTDDPTECFWFTREKDAEYRAKVFNYRVTRSYESRRFKGLTAQAVGEKL